MLKQLLDIIYSLVGYLANDMKNSHTCVESRQTLYPVKVPHTLLGGFQVTSKLYGPAVTGSVGKVTIAVGATSVVFNDRVVSVNMLLPKLFCTVTVILLILCGMETHHYDHILTNAHLRSYIHRTLDFVHISNHPQDSLKAKCSPVYSVQLVAAIISYALFD